MRLWRSPALPLRPAASLPPVAVSTLWPFVTPHDVASGAGLPDDGAAPEAASSKHGERTETEGPNGRDTCTCTAVAAGWSGMAGRSRQGTLAVQSATPLPSGTVVQADVTETFTLA